MKLPLRLLPLFIATLLPLQSAAQETIDRVSIIQLISSPEKFEGKMVLVTGFISLEFEGDAIYLHQEDYEHGLHRNGLWLDTNTCKERNGSNFSKGYALVIGRFTAKRHGHMDLWSGELHSIKSCQSWARRRDGT